MSNGNGRSTDGFGISREQSVQLIVRTCLANGVVDPRQIAYMLATAQHETRNFTAPEEDFGRAQARTLRYRGGEEYFGRGYVHLTHKDNYERMDRALGLNGALARDPSLAKDPEIAARILVIGMRDGMFTGRKLADYVDADTHDFYNARRTVNGVSATKPWSVKAARDCETYSKAWEARMPSLVAAVRRDDMSLPKPPALTAGGEGQLKKGQRGPEIEALQTRLNALGYRDAKGQRLEEDGAFGARTHEAVVAFQKASGIDGQGIVGPRTRDALARGMPAPVQSRPVGGHPVYSPAVMAILREADLHFLAGGKRFEYGRGDMRLTNGNGNGLTDRSRTEQDLDGDGLKGVDCSSFIWRGLKNAGYDVGNAPFSTHALFNGRSVTAYARTHFDVISAADARSANGSLQAGDILLFKDKDSPGQHVGIFRGYDANGHIRFIGSQVRTGPAEAGAGPGTYWNGKDFEIVGALRAKPEFQVRAPLHGQAAPTAERGADARTDSALQQTTSTATAGPARAAAETSLQLGAKGAAVATLQQRLAELDYRGRDGRPLGIDGTFGDNTKFALQAFQREHGLQGLGIAGPGTAAALDRAERALMSHPEHPHHPLYAQVLDRVHAEERSRGIAPGLHSARIAGALAVECLREGITRVDRVELNRDVSLVRGVQVSALRDEPGLNVVTDAISTRQATQQPMRESSEQMQQVAVNRQAQQADAQPRMATAVPAMAP